MLGTRPREAVCGFARWFAPLAVSVLLGAAGGSALAQQPSTFDNLLLKLKEKGVLTEEEYEALKQARDEEINDQRAARRKQALKDAQEAEKQEKAKEVAATQTKVETSPSVRSLQFYGDLRLRFEARDGYSPNPALGLAGNPNDLTRERWRYAARIGIRGDLSDNWFYGLRLDTGTNPRSAWVTFGGDSNAKASGFGPTAKNDDGIQIGQAFLGWRSAPWLTLQAGKMPNPMYTSVMLWDPDIAPEALAEKVSFKVDDSLELFGNFMQMMFADVNPDQKSTNGSVDLGFHKADAFMLGWQAGATYKMANQASLKAAITYYHYVGLDGFNAFTGQPYSGPFPVPTSCSSPQASVDACNAYYGTQNGVNNLQVLDIPLEFNFPVWGRNGRIFGDFAKNLDADARATAAKLPQYGGQDTAYQIGLAYGNLGMVYGQVAKKGTWEIRAYWQRIEQFALDPNLIDSDFFEGRTNLQGLYVAGAYSFTDAIIATLRYGYAQRINRNLGTGGSNPDLPYLNPIDDYRIFQFDLTWRF
jgi:hypothetical protein